MSHSLLIGLARSIGCKGMALNAPESTLAQVSSASREFGVNTTQPTAANLVKLPALADGDNICGYDEYRRA